MSTPFKPKPYQIAGFELFGRWLEDGRIQIGDSSYIDIVDEFPPEVEVCGVVYTLEYVKPNEISDMARGRLSPERIAEAERIQWGVYV